MITSFAEKLTDLAIRHGVISEEDRNVLFIGSFNSRDEIVDEWRKAGLTVEEQGSYLLERYWFNIYKVSIE